VQYERFRLNAEDGGVPFQSKGPSQGLVGGVLIVAFFEILSAWPLETGILMYIHMWVPRVCCIAKIGE
jgi:hypothetical protein